MKYQNAILVLALYFVNMGAYGQFFKMDSSDNSNTPDTLGLSFLDEEQVNFITSTKTVTIFEVNQFKALEGEENLMEEFKVINSQKLQAPEAEAIKSILLDTSNYFFTQKLKQCMFLPNMGLQLVSEQDTMNVMVSFDCETIRFKGGDGKTLLYNLYTGAEPFLGFFKNIFPTSPDPAAEENGPEEFYSAENDSLGLNSMGAVVQEECLTIDKPSPQKKPIYYLMNEGDCPYNLVDKVKNECKVTIALEEIYRLNNMTLGKFINLKPGDFLIVGYEEENNK